LELLETGFAAFDFAGRGELDDASENSVYGQMQQVSGGIAGGSFSSPRLATAVDDPKGLQFPGEKPWFWR
jgi:hypothetical protein